MDIQHSGEPEGDLIAAIIILAINDARSNTVEKSDVAMEAMHFLMTDRVDPYLSILGVDPDVFKEDLLRKQNSTAMEPGYGDNDKSRMKAIAQENKKRRIFRFNYERFCRTRDCYRGIRDSDRIFYQLYPNGFINWPMK